MYVCARFHEIPAKGLQDIKETKCYRQDGRTKTRTDGQRENSIPLKTSFLRGGGGIISGDHVPAVLRKLLCEETLSYSTMRRFSAV